MKKIIIIVVLFCFSAMTFKTEAEEINEIKDKDFLEFFKEFQEHLKYNKGSNDYIPLLIDCSSFNRDDYCNGYIISLIDFIGCVNSYYKELANLSKKIIMN